MPADVRIARWRSACLLLCITLLVIGLVSASPRADGPAVKLVVGNYAIVDEVFGQIASPGAFLLLAVIGLFI